jgi:uncharacterized integral membrane protein
MKIGTFFALVVLVVISVFAAINWGAFTTPTTLSLAFGVIHAPLGLIMLGVIAFVAVLFLFFSVYIRTSALLETHRHERDLQAMRELADHAEASRFTALQGLLEKETQRLADVDKESRAEVLTRLEQIQGALVSAINESGNTVAAYIGELEDRLEKGDRRQPPGPSA